MTAWSDDSTARRNSFSFTVNIPPTTWTPISHVPTSTRTSSAEEVKAAYHRALLKHHPDKAQKVDGTCRTNLDIATIKEAYDILSSPVLRSQYDAILYGKQRSVAVPRPAQLVSLEEFEEDGDLGGTWRYPCRCGGIYRITEDDMEKGIHLIGCDCCSEAVWVGFELSSWDNAMALPPTHRLRYGSSRSHRFGPVFLLWLLIWELSISF
ncbi:hypothetical protein WG66_016035 [Moniliophthora roreri]|nr:hypothetical protein WG66_016035 [Moniliophthora roreri]